MPTIQQQIFDHINNTSNPHNVTKEQLGLGGIQNFPLATVEEARSGNLTGRYLTPALLKEVFNGILIRNGYMDSSGNLMV